jgi:glycosyltransferase involved in cell wall biosynthesis
MHGRTGFLVQPDDVAAAARALQSVRTIDRHDCRQHAVEHLSLDASLAAHERLYQKLQAPAETKRRA